MTTLNRRRYRRLPASVPHCIIESDGHQATCDVLDESIGGYRIMGIDPMFLPRHQPLLIAHRDEIVEVFCTNVSRVKDKFSIGLQRVDTMAAAVSAEDWDDTIRYADSWQKGGAVRNRRRPEVKGALIRPFVRLRFQVAVACRIVQVREDKKLLVEVPGAKQFVVKPEMIRSLCRDERREELLKIEHIESLALIYSAGRAKEVAGDVESILNYEFDEAVM